MLIWMSRKKQTEWLVEVRGKATETYDRKMDVLNGDIFFLRKWERLKTNSNKYANIKDVIGSVSSNFLEPFRFKEKWANVSNISLLYTKTIKNPNSENRYTVSVFYN